jgi:hypothetical protein
MGLAPLMPFTTTLLAARNQRVITAWNVRQDDIGCGPCLDEHDLHRLIVKVQAGHERGKKAEPGSRHSTDFVHGRDRFPRARCRVRPRQQADPAARDVRSAALAPARHTGSPRPWSTRD